MPGIAVSSTETSPSLTAVVAEVDLDFPAFRSQTSPDGMLTIAFTDIERSTERMEKLGEHRWLELMLRHNRIVRSAVQRRGGDVVKTQGDGFMIVFSSASAALAWSVDLQRMLARNNPGGVEEPLLVRIGLHTGNIFQAEEDFLGRAVVLAARITGHAEGGQILVSAACRRYTRRARPWRYGEPVELILKGLAQPELVYPLDWTPI